MKHSSRWLYLRVAAFALAMSIGLRVQAEPPREEVAHAYHLLKFANANYGGARGAAMAELTAAGKTLDLHLEDRDLRSGDERQKQSNEQLAIARRLLVDARDKLEAHDRERVADHIESAIKSIDRGLRFSLSSQEITHAYHLLKFAEADYGGHKLKAMEDLKGVGKAMLLHLDEPDLRTPAERQFKSDAQLVEARRLIHASREKIALDDPEHLCDRLDAATHQIDEALRKR